eukprot:6504258-Pyramimonas_sp.AAC.1
MVPHEAATTPTSHDGASKFKVDNSEDDNAPKEVLDINAELTKMAQDFVHSLESKDENIIPEKWVKLLMVMSEGVQNEVKARTPARQQFGRWLKDKATEEELKDWAKVENSPDKARKCRTQWAEKRLKEAEEECRKATSYRKVESKNGVYRSFSRIVQEEGGHGDPSNVEAAENYCKACWAPRGIRAGLANHGQDEAREGRCRRN